MPIEALMLLNTCEAIKLLYSSLICKQEEYVRYFDARTNLPDIGAHAIEYEKEGRNPILKYMSSCSEA